MQHHFTLFFLIFSLSLSAQHTSVSSKDFNNDGIEDLLKCTFKLGDAYGGASCDLLDGKTKKKFTLSNYGCYCAIKKWVYVDPELRKKENEYFLYTLKNEILPEFKSFPDQSLNWIMQSGLNTSVLKDNTYFDLYFNPKTNWRTGEPERPFNYTIVVNAKTLSKISPKEKELTSKIRDLNERDFLVYYGNTHFSTENEALKDFVSVAKNQNYELLKTAHGVVIKKQNTFKWLFVTDNAVADSLKNLRWPSIQEVILHDTLVIVKQNLAASHKFHVYAIAIESGVVARLKIDSNIFEATNDEKAKEPFTIKNNTIVIGEKGNQMKFPLEKIKKELDLIAKGK